MITYIDSLIIVVAVMRGDGGVEEGGRLITCEYVNNFSRLEWSAASCRKDTNTPSLLTISKGPP